MDSSAVSERSLASQRSAPGAAQRADRLRATAGADPAASAARKKRQEAGSTGGGGGRVRRAASETAQGRHAQLETRCELLATRVLQWAYLNARQDHAVRVQEARAAAQLEAAWRIVGGWGTECAEGGAKAELGRGGRWAWPATAAATFFFSPAATPSPPFPFRPDNARTRVAKQRTALDMARANQRLHHLLQATTPALEEVGRREPDLVQDYRQLSTALERTTRHLPLDGVLPVAEGTLETVAAGGAACWLPGCSCPGLEPLTYTPRHPSPEKLAQAMASENSALSVCLDDTHALARALQALSSGAVRCGVGP